MTSDLIQLKTCRACSSNFSYSLHDNSTVTIITGIPAQDVKYKAISHVWGETILVNMVCKSCNTIIEVPLRSKDTFIHMMTLAGPDSHIWLDNMSIDQSDHADITCQIAVMGDIYSKAECVSVLLPASDSQALTTLKSIVEMAELLLDLKWQFDYLPERDYYPLPDGKDPFDGIEETGKIAKKFLESIMDLDRNLQKYTYWQRAWTFQEWCLAHDIEIACDGSMTTPSDLLILQQVKSTIVYVAIMIADYKLRRGQYARMELGFSRGDIVIPINAIKQLFPFENAFLSYEEINQSELLFQISMPNLGTNEILGLRATPHAIQSPAQKFRARLNIMLEAYIASNNKRIAKYEADLVCCWASMCNIQYQYSKDDPWELALMKAIRAIRSLGVKLFNFCVSKHAGAEIDYEFYSYAISHLQSNATNCGHFLGPPVLTGRADTIRHFFNIIIPSQKELRVKDFKCPPVMMVGGAVVRGRTLLSNKNKVINDIGLATSGSSDKFIFTDILIALRRALDDTPDSVLRSHNLITVAIPVAAGTSDMTYFYAWAICPSSITPNALFVAREELNGTLVLAALSEENSTVKASIIAYLTVTDQQSGTFLIPVSSDGKVQIKFQTPQRGDMASSRKLADRHLKAQLHLGKKAIPGSTLPYSKIKGFKLLPSNSHIVDVDTEDDGKLVLRGALDKIIARSNESEFGGLQDFLTIDIGHPRLNARGEASKKNAPRLRTGSLDDL